MQKKILRKKNKKGFTLMEMLVVIAIIAIFIAVSLPMYTDLVNKAKSVTDAANLRNAKQLASAMYVLKQENFDTAIYFDLENETFVSEPPAPYGQSQANSSKVISAVWNPTTQKIDLEWVEPD